MGRRDARYECIRVISMIFVIGVHSLANIPRSSGAEVLAGQVFSTLFFLSNGLFFMISGKFALNARCERAADYVRFYLKRIGSIGIPVLGCMLLRSMYNIGWWPDYFLSLDFAKEYAANVLGNFSTCEYWFLYDLAGFLAVSPFLGKLLQRASKTDLWALLAVGVGYNALQTYLPALGVPFSWKFPLGGWIVIYILGYALEKLVTTEREEKRIMLLGGLCFLLTVAQQHLGFAPGANDLAPAYAVMVSGAFLALKRLYRPGKRLDRLVCGIGKHSLTVYLLHMMVLYRVLPYIPFEGLLLRLPALIVTTAAVTLLLAVLLDNTVFRLLQWAYRKLFRL